MNYFYYFILFVQFIYHYSNENQKLEYYLKQLITDNNIIKQLIINS